MTAPHMITPHDEPKASLIDEPTDILSAGIGALRVTDMAQAIQLRQPLGREDLAREIIASATGYDRFLMSAYTTRLPHPHVTANNQQLAARYESKVHDVAQLFIDLPETLWDEVIDLLSSRECDRAYAIVMDMHGHIAATIGRYARESRFASAAAD